MGFFTVGFISETKLLWMVAHLFRKLVMNEGSASRRLQLIPIEYPPHWKFVT